MSLSTLRYEIYTELKNEHNRCWYNASYNRCVYRQTKNLKLHWVVGGIMYAKSRKNRDYTVLGFIKNKYGEPELRKNFNNYLQVSDTHAWLEDDDGNVWDYLHPEDVERHNVNAPDWKLKAGYIRGIHRSVLAKLGYELYPHPVETQKKILEMILDQDGYIPAEIEDTLEMIQEGWKVG